MGHDPLPASAASYYLDADEIMWRFVEEDEGERILHSTEHDAMHPQWVVEEHYGPLVPLYREQTVEKNCPECGIRESSPGVPLT